MYRSVLVGLIVFVSSLTCMNCYDCSKDGANNIKPLASNSSNPSVSRSLVPPTIVRQPSNKHASDVDAIDVDEVFNNEVDVHSSNACSDDNDDSSQEHDFSDSEVVDEDSQDELDYKSIRRTYRRKYGHFKSAKPN